MASTPIVWNPKFSIFRMISNRSIDFIKQLRNEDSSLDQFLKQFSAAEHQNIYELVDCLFQDGLYDNAEENDLKHWFSLLISAIKDLNQINRQKSLLDILHHLKNKCSFPYAILLGLFPNIRFCNMFLSDEQCSHILQQHLQGTPWYQTLLRIKDPNPSTDQTYGEISTIGLIVGFSRKFIEEGFTLSHLEARLPVYRTCEELESLTASQVELAARCPDFRIEIIKTFSDENCNLLLTQLNNLDQKDSDFLIGRLLSFSTDQLALFWGSLSETNSAYKALLLIKFPGSCQAIQMLSAEICKEIYPLTHSFALTCSGSTDSHEEKGVDFQEQQFQVLLGILSLAGDNQISKIQEISRYINHYFPFLKAAFLAQFPEAEKYRLNLESSLYLKVIQDYLSGKQQGSWYQMLVFHLCDIHSADLPERDCIALIVGFSQEFVSNGLTDSHWATYLSSGKSPEKLMQCSEKQVKVWELAPHLSLRDVQNLSDDQVERFLKNFNDKIYADTQLLCAQFPENQESIHKIPFQKHRFIREVIRSFSENQLEIFWAALLKGSGVYQALSLSILPEYEEKISQFTEDQCEKIFLLKDRVDEDNIDDIAIVSLPVWKDIGEFITDLDKGQFSILLDHLKGFSEQSNQLIIGFSKEALGEFRSYLFQGLTLDRSFALARFYDPLVRDVTLSKTIQYNESIQDVRSSSEKICKKIHQLSNQEFLYLIQDIVNGLSFYKALCRLLLGYNVSFEKASLIPLEDIKNYLDRSGDLDPSQFEPIITRLQSDLALFPWQILSESAGHSRNVSMESRFSNMSTD